MKLLKTLLAIAIVLLIIVIMAQTVPDKERHKEAMMEAVKEFVDSEADEMGIADNALTRLGKNVAVKAVETALNSKLRVHDYYVLNTTYVRLQGKEHTLSLGVLGMVFTFDKEKLREKLKEALEVKEDALTEKQAAKKSSKELKKLEREKRRLEKKQEREQKKREKQAMKERKRQEKEKRKREKEATNNNL